MAARPPGDLSHLERLLRAWVDETNGQTAARARTLVAVTVVAQMLDGLRDSDGKHLFVFKGGAGLQMRFGSQARATKDLDAAYREDMDLMVEQVTAAVAEGWSGFTGRITNVEPITRAGVSPAPIRMKIKLQYRRRNFMTLPFEVSAAEASSVDDPELVPIAVNLEPLQLQGPDELPLLPLRYQIAQKLYTCSEPSTDGATNDRARDLADLDLIEDLAVYDDDFPVIRQACVEIFDARQKHPWPPVVAPAAGWEAIWADLAAKNGLEMTLEQAIAAANVFVERIDAAR